MENLTRTNNVAYELYSNVLGKKTIQEPVGWNEDVRSLERDKKSRGMIRKTDIALEFYGDGADFITTMYTSFGISERILLSKYEKDQYSLSEDWKLRYVQELDLKTYKKDKRTGKVTVKAHEGGLLFDIKARESEDYDLFNNESADGDDIGELIQYDFQPIPRKIFVESLLKMDRARYSVSTAAISLDDPAGFDQTARSLPLDMVYNSDSDDIYEPSRADENLNEQEDFYYTNFQQSNAFFYRAELEKTIRVVLNMDFNIDEVYSRNSKNKKLFVTLHKGGIATDGTDEHLERIELLAIDAPQGQVGTGYNVSYDEYHTLAEGQSLSLNFEIYSETKEDNWFDRGQTMKAVAYINASGELRVEDTTQYKLTIGKCIKPYDFFDRLIAKITGKTGLFRSSLFEKGGKYENFVLDNGFMARGFPQTYTDGEEEISIQLKTSFKDAFESFGYLEPMAWFVETEGNKQVIRMETAKHTQQNFIGIDLGEVDDIEEEASEVDYFGSIELGHEGSLEYEELNGLDEYNGKSEFGSHLKNSSSKYSVLSKYRFDAVGYELIRRKNYTRYPKEDTSRDEDIWIHDTKYVTMSIPILFHIHTYEIFTHRTWQDLGHDQKPKGIFDPDTAWNLDLSPMNRLLYGHAYSVKRGLYHNRSKKIRFNSSNSNQNLITYNKGIELKESGSFSIGDAEKNRVQASKVTLSFKMDQELENKFSESTQVGDKLVPNYFGLVRYLENGEYAYGRITKLTGDKDSKLQLIKAGI